MTMKRPPSRNTSRPLSMRLCRHLLMAVVLGVASIATANDVFTQVITLEPTSYSMFDRQDGSSRPIVEQIYNGLVRFEDFGTPPTIVPDLAESFEMDADGRIFTFHLRRGIQFHKGYGELTAEDVRFTIESHMDSEMASFEMATFAAVERVETPDPYTVRIVLKESFPGFLTSLAWQAGFIMSKRAFEELGRDGIARDPIGTGAYYLDRVVARERVVLRRFEDYFGPAAQIETVQFRIIPEEAVGVSALLRGEVDAVPIQTPSAFRLVQAMSQSLQIVEAPGGQNWYQIVNAEKEPTNDVRVRQAMLYAIDFGAVTQAFGGFLQPNMSYLNPLNYGWIEDWRPEYFSPDVDRARELMKEAGYTERPELRITFTSGELYIPLAEFLAEQLRPIMDVKLNLVDRAAWVAAIDGREWNVLIAALTRLESDQYSSMLLHSSGRFALHGQKSPVLDDLVVAARGEVDPEARAEAYQQLQRVVLDDVITFNMGTALAIMAVGRNVVGYAGNPYTGVTRLAEVHFLGE